MNESSAFPFIQRAGSRLDKTNPFLNLVARSSSIGTMQFYRKLCSLCYWKHFTKSQPAYHVRLALICGTVLMILIIAYFSDPITQRRSPISDHKYSFHAQTISFGEMEAIVQSELTHRYTFSSMICVDESSPPIFLEIQSFLI